MPDNFYLYLGLAVVVAAVFASVVIVFRNQVPRRRAPTAVAQGFRLKAMVAETMMPLGPEIHEAIRLYAWAEQVGWETVAQNVLVSEDFPLTKKALT